MQFREKLRGYHPDDVDDFVASVASTLDAAQARIAALEARIAEVESQPPEPAEADDSLRRTLVLAQRTADLAIQEAREDAARLLAEARTEHDEVTAEAASLRTRLHQEAEDEVRPVREQLLAERAALQSDVDAINAYLERERERLRIYFTDQLRRVEEGYPGLSSPPEMQAPPAPATAAEPVATAGQDADPEVKEALAADAGPHDDGDAFLAELRRAVADDAPLGPRDDDASEGEPPQGDEFDMFSPAEDDGGRFGGLRRRRR